MESSDSRGQSHLLSERAGANRKFEENSMDFS